MRTFVNGVATDKISINDRGLQFADGLFETMRIINYQPEDLKLHLQRMQQSCKRLAIKFPQIFAKEIIQICAKNKQNGILKLILTRGNSDVGLKINPTITPNRIIKITNLPNTIEHYQNTGIALNICKTRLSDNPAIIGLKSLNWLPNILANLELGTNYQEGLMLDRMGNIIEGISSNFFIIKNDELITPDLTNCGLSGITRKKILKIASNLGIKTQETIIKRSDEFDACFISNSIIGIYPVIKLNQTNYLIHKITKKIQSILYKNTYSE